MTPVYNTPQWKEGLKYLQRLYAQGLIDPQSFTQDIDGLQRLGNNPDKVILGAAPCGLDGRLRRRRRDLQDDALDRLRPRAASGGTAGRPLRRPGVRPPASRPRSSPVPARTRLWRCAGSTRMYDREATLRSERGVLGEDWRWAEEGETDFNGEQAVWKILRGSPASRPTMPGREPAPKFTAQRPLGVAGRRSRRPSTSSSCFLA